MDFYGFSNGVQQANALNMGSALANNAYNSINTGLLNNFDSNNVKKDNVGINKDITDVNSANTQTLTDEIVQGGGTGAGVIGVGTVGKSIRDVGNQLGKAKRIATEHLKLATASGDSSEISKAQSLLDATDKGDLKSFVRLTGKFANQRSVTKALGSNIDRAVTLASDINTGSSFGPAAASVSTSAGRTANSQIVARAAEIADKSTPEVASSIAGGTIEAASTSRTRLKAARLAARAKFLDEGSSISEPSILGTAGRPSTLRQVNVAERSENPDGIQDDRDLGEGGEFSDELFNEPSINRMASSITATPDVAVDVEGEGAAARTIKTVGTSDVISNLGLGTGGDMLTGTETIGQRGIAATLRSGFQRAIGVNKGVLDLASDGGLEDVDENGATLGRLGSGWAQNISRSSTVTPAAPAPTPAPVEVEAAPVPDVAEAPARVAEQASVPAVEKVAGAATTTGSSAAANLIGSSEHAEAIAGGGIDEVGIKAISSLGGFSGAVGGAALKTVSTLGKVAKVAGPIASAGFLVDQTYEEGKSLLGGTHSLEGTGGWEKGGNVLKEVGDAAATVGGVLALAGPATLGLSDVAALGVELGGGALALAGDLMDDYGKAKQDKAATAAAGNKLAADKAQAAKDATASNQSVQIANAAGNRNLSGKGSIAQVSQSAVRSY